MRTGMGSVVTAGFNSRVEGQRVEGTWWDVKGELQCEGQACAEWGRKGQMKDDGNGS